MTLHVPVLGIDVSYAQKPAGVDYGKLADVADFLIIKASQGVRRALCFTDHLRLARAANVTVLGAYHILDFREKVPVADQIDHYLDTNPLRRGSFPPILDIETSAIKRAPNHAAHTLQRAVEYLRYRTGLWPMVYISARGVRHLQRSGNVDFLSHTPLWLCDYSAIPTTPKPWKRFTLWQKTSHGDGPAFGVPGRVDLDQFNGDRAAFHRWILSLHWAEQR